MSAYIPALAAIAVAVFTAIWGAVIYPRQKAVDRQNYADQKAIDREEYAAQKKTDREIELRNRRMKEYESYLIAFRKDARLYDYGRIPAVDSKEKIETVNEYWLAYGTLFQLAPDPVLLAVADFHKFAWLREPYVESDEAYDRRFKTLYAAMIIEMRKKMLLKRPDCRRSLLKNYYRFISPKQANPRVMRGRSPHVVEPRGGGESDK